MKKDTLIKAIIDNAIEKCGPEHIMLLAYYAKQAMRKETKNELIRVYKSY